MGTSATTVVLKDEQIQNAEQAIEAAFERIVEGLRDRGVPVNPSQPAGIDTPAGVTPIAADSHVVRKNSKFAVEVSEAKAVAFAGGDDNVKAEIIAAIQAKFAGKIVDVDTIEFAAVKLRRAASVAATGKATKTFAIYATGVADPIADGFEKVTDAKRTAVELVNSGETSYTELEVRAVVGKDGNAALVKVARPVDADRTVKVAGTVDVITIKAKAPVESFVVVLAA
ncbi:hypothetical protein [Agromyces humi]|uniref:hypothetical protein n=1 Tax=Agromyces humi TaxID=1766800 RepID=UPI001359689F|nr:hypothetical protein [Agromyces humi]